MENDVFFSFYLYKNIQLILPLLAIGYKNPKSVWSFNDKEMLNCQSYILNYMKKNKKKL